MKILVVAPRVPWPPLDGGRVAINAIALGLRDAGAEVELVALNPLKHRSDAREIPDRRGALALTALPHDTSMSALRVGLGLLSRTRSVVASRFQSRALESFVRDRVARGDVDVVQIEGPMLARCIAAARSGGARAIVAMRSQNVEHEIWQRLADGARRPASRVAMRRVATQLRQHERAANAASDALVAISAGDLAAFRALGYAKPAMVIPIGIDTGGCDAAPAGIRGIFFIGSLDYRPNVEGLAWLADEVMPRVRRLAPSLSVVAAGSNPPAELVRKAEDAGIRIVGQVPDARAFMAASGVMAVPLLSGSGVRVKIAEAMALGVPVVSTTIGAEGLGLESGRELVIADGADEFAEALVSLEGDLTLRARLAAASREFVARELDREQLGRRLVEFYRGLRA
ncbi:MAG: glycosyltransferase family 4 protein [Thermoanaerobaculia bacterium]|jgi:glycosyltransferase involved in cell wall biosynthesis